MLERHLQSGFGAVPRLRALTVDRPSLSELLPEVESVIFKFENAMKQAETRLRELGVLPPVQGELFIHKARWFCSFSV